MLCGTFILNNNKFYCIFRVQYIRKVEAKSKMRLPAFTIRKIVQVLSDSTLLYTKIKKTIALLQYLTLDNIINLVKFTIKSISKMARVPLKLEAR